MSENIDVDPVDIHLAARSIRQHAEDLKTAHRRSESSAQSAQGGWVGDSASALASLIPSWERFSESVDSQLASHSAQFISSAIAYTSTDTKNATSIQKPTTPTRLKFAD